MSPASVLSLAILLVIGLPFAAVLYIIFRDDAEVEQAHQDQALRQADYYTTRRIQALTKQTEEL